MSKGVWWRWVYVFLSSCPAEGARQGLLRLSNTTPRQVHPTPALSVRISTPVIFTGLIVAMFTCPSAHLDMGCPMEGFRGFQGTPIMLPSVLPPAIFYVHVGFLLLSYMSGYERVVPSHRVAITCRIHTYPATVPPFSHQMPNIAQMSVWTFNTFGNNFRIIHKFTKYLNKNCGSCPDQYIPFKYFTKNALFTKTLSKKSR